MQRDCVSPERHWRRAASKEHVSARWHCCFQLHTHIGGNKRIWRNTGPLEEYLCNAVGRHGVDMY
jgi:hypothetical protein